MVKERERVQKIILIIVLVVCVLCLLLLAGYIIWQRQLGYAAVETTTELVVFTTPIEETTLPPTTTEPPTEPPTEPTEPPIPLNRFKPENFSFEDDYLTCNTEWFLTGIDVSKYQGWIDWQKVKDAGISFVMIRVGGRGYGKAGNMFPDDMAYTNYIGAKEAGLQVGAYFFSQATNTEEAVAEAQYALALTEGWELDLPIVFDWEYLGDYARTADVEDRTLTDCAIAFCEEIEAAGRSSMIYVSPWFGKLILEDLTEYPQWLALYTCNMTYRYHFDMWQYSCSGSVPGIRGNVDLNLMFPFE